MFFGGVLGVRTAIPDFTQPGWILFCLLNLFITPRQHEGGRHFTSVPQPQKAGNKGNKSR